MRRTVTFNDEQFDNIKCQGLVQHTPDKERFSAECCKVINKGNMASISVNYLDTILRLSRYLLSIVKIFVMQFLLTLGRVRNIYSRHRN